MLNGICSGDSASVVQCLPLPSDAIYLVTVEHV
jgi:hypothetical protein